MAVVAAGLAGVLVLDVDAGAFVSLDDLDSPAALDSPPAFFL